MQMHARSAYATRRPFRKTVALAALVVLAVTGATGSAARAQLGGAVSFQPLIIPITISVDENGKPSLSGSASIVTPVGVISFSGSASAPHIEPANTYFDVRMNGGEKIYWIGKRGKLRLQTEGEHDIELSNYSDYANVIVVDVKSKRGSVKLEFVPDDTTDDLARIHYGTTDLALYKQGALVIDAVLDTVIPKSMINKVLFADMSGDDRMVVSVDYTSGGKRYSEFWICDGTQRVEALWMRECLRRLNIAKTKDIGVTDKFTDRFFVFDDGSILFTHFIRTGEFGYATPLEFIASDFLGGLAFDDGNLLNLYSPGLKVTYAHPRTARSWNYSLTGKDTPSDIKRLIATSNRLRAR
jgi:hypothetical protein